MKYKHELAKRIKKSGRSRKWISAQLEMSRQTFWRKVINDSFTKEEKQKIKTLLYE